MDKIIKVKDKTIKDAILGSIIRKEALKVQEYIEEVIEKYIHTLPDNIGLAKELYDKVLYYEIRNKKPFYEINLAELFDEIKELGIFVDYKPLRLIMDMDFYFFE